jgi:hypothetical protein
MGNFRLDSSAERAIGTPVLAQLRRLSSASSLSDRAADRANPGTDARANLGTRLQRCQDQLQCSQYVARPFAKIAESDQSFTVFARGDFRSSLLDKARPALLVIKTAKGHAGKL